MRFKKVKIVVGIAVDHDDTDVVVGVVRVGGLVDGREADGDDVEEIEARVERVGLTSVDHEKHFVIAAMISQGRVDELVKDRNQLSESFLRESSRTHLFFSPSLLYSRREQKKEINVIHIVSSLTSAQTNSSNLNSQSSHYSET